MPNASLVIANWKMNGNRELTKIMSAALREQLSQLQHVKLVVCPPFTLIGELANQCYYDEIAIGAQNVSEHSNGAFTGEISTAQLQEFGVSYVLVGHSERRQLFAETDDMVNKKALAAVNANMTAVVCVGENKAQRDEGNTLEVVSRQAKAALANLPKEKAGKVVLAYEPVWAIGTGETASPEQAQDVHAKLRTLLVEQFGVIGEKRPLLYGGSVKADNAAKLFAQKDIDGGLIGGASLKESDFVAICQAAQG
ncbi:triose-phosphate isomerase [Idiomarina aminovorans]|uniref:triose-phosphate isomerase n=1 Tax=Idiomarina aminovorans TaxID=2914829 RepID=UPI0020064AD8|nr:triose-phosphate isomerase [Idiomarina sp. ATCH4]MCK7458211.1 triose-phosphate isomerase [Idiomarina sp. ATCH4]